jgi:hypothetical protein
MLTGKKTTRNDLHAVFGAPESTLIQPFAGLSNIKFSELRIVEMKEHCSIPGNEDEDYPCEGAGARNTLSTPTPFIHIQHGNLVKIRTVVFYMITRLGD